MPPPDQSSLAAFSSNGDLIQGWYWLRDRALKHYASWTLVDVPTDQDPLEIEMEVLATNTVSGGRGYDAKFKLFYGTESNPAILRGGSGTGGSITVELPNVSPTSDPVGYTCRGTVEIPAAAVINGTLSLKAMRLSASDNHVAFKKESIKNFTVGEGTLPDNDEDDSNDNSDNNNNNDDNGDAAAADPDSDNDLVTDSNEALYRTDPGNPDSDGDGVIDGKDLSPLLNPAEPDWIENQKVGMIRIEQPIKAYGLDGWAEKWHKTYSFWGSEIHFDATYEDEGTKKSEMNEAEYKKALNNVFSANHFAAYKVDDITPGDIAVADEEWTHDHDAENSLTFSANFWHRNEYRFYYDYLTDYQRAFLKNNEEIKYPEENNYFRYLLSSLALVANKENILSIQFYSPATYAQMSYQDDSNYKLPGFIYSLHESDNFNDDNNKTLHEGLALAAEDDPNLFQVSLRFPAEKVKRANSQLKISPVWVEKTGGKVSYQPLLMNWDIKGLSRDVIYSQSDNGNSKVMSEEMAAWSDLAVAPKPLSFFNGSGSGFVERSEWQGLVKKDPNADDTYEIQDMTTTITSHVSTGSGVVLGFASLTENLVTASNGVDEISDLPDTHWIRSPKYGTALAGLNAAAGIASLAANGHSAWVAYKEGDTVTGIYYTAQVGLTAGQTTQALVQVAENTVGFAGKAGKLAGITSKKASVGLAVAVGAVEIAYDSYNLANTDDPILETAYTENIIADVANTGLSIAAVFSPHVLVFQVTWAIEAEIYAAIFGEDFAYRVAQNPGSALVFLGEYFFTDIIPSQMAEDAYLDIREELIEQIENLNAVQLPYLAIFIDPDL